MRSYKIGIPRSLFYYYQGTLWKYFFEKLGHEFIISPKTNAEIMRLGNDIATDEMCLSFKNFLGHVKYLEDKCDCILVPRIDNYGTNNQTCTNFLAAFDIVSNCINKPILNYNIAVSDHETEQFGFYMLGKVFHHNKIEIDKAYQYAKEEERKELKKKIEMNEKKLYSHKIKILLVGHPYNLYDEMIGVPIVKLLKKYYVEVLYSDAFPKEITSKLSKKLSSSLYFKYNKENIGAIELVKDKIDGVIFLTSFPCGPDSLVNELVMHKMKLPYLNLVLDEIESLTGMETRIESFFDILEERRNILE